MLPVTATNSQTSYQSFSGSSDTNADETMPLPDLPQGQNGLETGEIIGCVLSEDGTNTIQGATVHSSGQLDNCTIIK